MDNELKKYGEAVMKELKKLFPEKTFRLEEVKKNNGNTYYGITGYAADSEVNCAAPVVYFNNYFEEGLSVEEAAEKMKNTFKSFPTMEMEIDIEDWEKVKDKICFKIVGKKGNEEFPHVDIADDIQAVFYVPVLLGNGLNGSIPITKQRLGVWGKDVQELYVLAEKNTPVLYPYKFQSMEQVMAEMLRAQGFSNYEIDAMMADQTEPEVMYVLSNINGWFGAATILYPELLEKLEKRIGKFIIIPSSVHDVILMALELMDEGNLDYVAEMIKAANGTLDDTDVLSEQAYIFENSQIKPLLASSEAVA